MGGGSGFLMPSAVVNACTPGPSLGNIRAKRCPAPGSPFGFAVGRLEDGPVTRSWNQGRRALSQVS